MNRTVRALLLVTLFVSIEALVSGCSISKLFGPNSERFPFTVSYLDTSIVQIFANGVYCGVAGPTQVQLVCTTNAYWNQSDSYGAIYYAANVTITAYSPTRKRSTPGITVTLYSDHYVTHIDIRPGDFAQ